jgi:Kef-type K+ transport system membrane component KefB
MQHIAEFLSAIGGILLLGLATDYLGKHTFLPRVTLLLIIGIIVGDKVLGIIPLSVTSRFELIADMALLMIGFLLGGKLTFNTLKQEGQLLLWVSLSATLGTSLIVTFALMAAGLSMEIAILLGCIAAATAPAATVDVVQESGDQSGFSRLLLAIVAIDDAWAMILFSMGLATVSLLSGLQESSLFLLDAGYEILGALLLGGLIGVPAAYLTGRIRPGQPMLTEALGLVFLCGGIAIWLEVSFLIAVMAMGAVVANLARHHDYPFHEIENIEWPFMIIFFILAGASLEFGMLTELGLIGVVYLIARVGGKLFGAWFGARIGRADHGVRRWMGVALMPQAGVAIGMALVAANQFPEHRQIILSIVISTTIFFELIGPVLTRMAIKKTRQESIKKGVGDK